MAGKASSKATKDEGAASATGKLTREQRNKIFRDAGGKCYVTGAQCDALDLGDKCHIVDGRLVTADVAKMKGGRTWSEFAAYLLGELNRAESLIATFGKLHGVMGGGVRFAGETAAPVTTTAPPTAAAPEAQ